MKEILTLIFFIAITYTAYGQSRSPAVEPFIEVQHNVQIKNKELGKFAAFNFENAKPATTASDNNTLPFFTIFTLLAFLCLPVLMWRAILKNEELNEQENVYHVQFGKKTDVKKQDDDDDDDYSQAA